MVLPAWEVAQRGALLVDLVLMVPLGMTAAVYGRCRFREHGPCLWRAINMGWPISAALAYAVVFGWPSGTVTTFWDEVGWRAGIIILFAPQSVILLALGTVGIAVRRDVPNRALALA